MEEFEVEFEPIPEEEEEEEEDHLDHSKSKPRKSLEFQDEPNIKDCPTLPKTDINEKDCKSTVEDEEEYNHNN